MGGPSGGITARARSDAPGTAEIGDVSGFQSELLDHSLVRPDFSSP